MIAFGKEIYSLTRYYELLLLRPVTRRLDFCRLPGPVFDPPLLLLRGDECGLIFLSSG